MNRKCFLKCVLDSHPPIELPHGKEITIGRSKETKIKDQSCSREQLSFKANCEECTVTVRQLGVNSSGLDGFALKKSSTYTVQHGSKIEFLAHNYLHVIEFDPPPESSESSKANNEHVKIPSKENNKGGVKRKSDEIESKPKKKKVEEDISNDVPLWEDIDSSRLIIHTSKGVRPRNKIAGFDMDGTLITTKSGKICAVNEDDWQMLFPTIPNKLKELTKDDFRIVIFTNQAPIGNGKVKIESFKKKVEKIVAALGVPVQVYIATGKDTYRKPMTGMWDYLIKKKNGGLDVDISTSFYCGDAAGRVVNWAPGKKKDHSLADRFFAENLQLTFYTPEQFFLGHSVSNVAISKPSFDPKKIESVPFNPKLISEEQEVLVLVGYPGSGKSFLAKQIEEKSDNKYVTVCRDTLGSWQNCADKLRENVKKGRSVIVDCTNPDLDSRKRWITAAREAGVQCRCAWVTTSMAHAQHNNRFRELMKEYHVPVGDVVFYTYKNKFSIPVSSEGFKEIIEVKFSPVFFDSNAENLYRMHLLEK